ncbi:hypothetical protein FNV43_RR12420 [Rhamnella rubrinervis]|uniref:Uncharacterized protein n=1 Tax=Rhamnella rubrinervis TaxID=2594499 RepID=A0A8K0H898_9ROSA|nr:hypothetical protein FNV43_RR12420 [Rhamnella rubrinervis]
MVEVWWFVLGAAIPCVVAAGEALNTNQRKAAEEERLKKGTGAVDMDTNGGFVCERVCISKRLQNKIGGGGGGGGGLYKDASVVVDSCVTVCGFGEVDTACLDACARTVCAHQHHHLPNWNDLRLGRCQSECLKLSNKTL